MIKSLGNAMKKMAQRSMWRGNRDDAHAIESHGMYGMRSNNQARNQNNSSQDNNSTTNNTSTPLHLNSSAGNIHTNSGTIKKDDKKDQNSTKDNLGGNIMDALQ